MIKRENPNKEGEEGGNRWKESEENEEGRK